MVGDALGVVAGGCGDDSAGGLLRSEGGDAVERATLLEGAGHLEVLELEVDLLAGEVGENLRVRAGGSSRWSRGRARERRGCRRG